MRDLLFQGKLSQECQGKFFKFEMGNKLQEIFEIVQMWHFFVQGWTHLWIISYGPQ